MTRHLTLLAKAALAVGAAFAIFACGREEMPEVVEIPGQAGNDEVEPVTGVREIQFRALPVKTKAQFGAEENGCWPTLWTANDSELKLSLNYGTAQTAGVTPSQDFQSATFSATIDFTGVKTRFHRQKTA